MSNEIARSHSTIDPYKHLQIVVNPDGTITRSLISPSTEATPDPVNDDAVVLSKDVTVNQSKNTWVRIFVPRQALDSPSSTKLPLIVDFHGGGFIFFSAASSLSHEFCSNVAVELPAIVVSVDYRLAPEHRLPAAYDDAMDALHWIKNTQDDWLMKHADFDNCFLIGSSAGGNIAYYAGLRATAQVNNLLPLKIKGLLLFPFFGAIKRTTSELRLVNDRVSPPCLSDLMWELALPIGADRDHEYCNPKVEGGSKLVDQIRLLGWKVMVIGCDRDPLIDRQIELVRMMEHKEMQVVTHFQEGGYHGIEIIDPVKRKVLLVDIKKICLVVRKGSIVSTRMVFAVPYTIISF
ncbi:putative carboxylesterase 120 [Citrus sinensis]|uniref:Carboxylesterase 120 n=1 Tax=Citrus sinensis TaxID=2711 RepID=A0ACB8HUM1_CITSI|nr:putative carboxylesterase 120 [Citrus sinensis]